MQCKDCGEEFPNLNALTRHKAICPGIIPEANEDDNTAAKEMENELNDILEEETPEDKPDGPFLIPLELCPEELKYYAPGKSLGLRITGTLTDNGVVVEEVKLIR